MREEHASRQKLRIIFAGGGTGGHLYPALAIAGDIRAMRPDARITFIGTRGKIEARVVPERGYDFAAIWIGGLSRRLSMSLLLFPLKLVIAFGQSLALLMKIRPAVVVGTGGYVSGPVVLASVLCRIPTLLQEQNSYPGITTRLLSGLVDEVHTTFEATRRFLSRRATVVLSGNPTREEVGAASRQDAAGYFAIDPGRTTVLVFGGSLGASSLNAAVEKLLPDLRRLGVQLLWQTGERDFARANAAVQRETGAGRSAIRAFAFIDRMEFAYAACDLAVCRAGATTLAELTRAGVPSILVPYPYAAEDHQAKNAQAMKDEGASVVCPDASLDVELRGMLEELLARPETLKRMSVSARRLGKPEAARALAAAVMRLAGESHD